MFCQNNVTIKSYSAVGGTAADRRSGSMAGELSSVYMKPDLVLKDAIFLFLDNRNMMFLAMRAKGRRIRLRYTANLPDCCVISPAPRGAWANTEKTVKSFSCVDGYSERKSTEHPLSRSALTILAPNPTECSGGLDETIRMRNSLYFIVII